MAFDFLKNLFGKKQNEQEGQSENNVQKAQKQVYTGRPADPPEFAENVSASQLAKACQENAVCKFAPRVQQQRIYTVSSQEAGGGDMPIEYEGIAAICPAIQEFGDDIAREDGYARAYRYVDLNHIYECCCGDPGNCRFYNKAMQEREDVNRQFRVKP